MEALRILHTADWHLGKGVWDISLLCEQEALLEQIVQQADENDVHVVVVAGDVFDSPKPSFEAERLFAKALLRLSAGGRRPVLVISGNHDSARGLETFQNWGIPLGILLLGFVPNSLPNTLGDCQLIYYGEGLIELHHKHWAFPVRFLLSPHVPLSEYLLRNEEISPVKALAQRWRAALARPESKAPTILIAHLYVQFDTDRLDEDEADKISAGGQVPPLPVDIFPSELSYVALGHIHRPYYKRRQDNLPIAYAGSLMQYSFGDKVSDKQTWLVEVDASGHVSGIKSLPLRVPRKLLRQRASTLEEAQQILKAYRDDFIELLWTGETTLSPLEHQDLRQLHDRFRIVPARENTIQALAEIVSFAGQDLRLMLPRWFRE
ncbi:MAG: exonuclease subunit SbcD, partial [Candidatus Caldarchaeum sp.]